MNSFNFAKRFNLDCFPKFTAVIVVGLLNK